jgi:hypothetical protein
MPMQGLEPQLSIIPLYGRAMSRRWGSAELLLWCKSHLAGKLVYTFSRHCDIKIYLSRNVFPEILLLREGNRAVFSSNLLRNTSSCMSSRWGILSVQSSGSIAARGDLNLSIRKPYRATWVNIIYAMQYTEPHSVAEQSAEPYRFNNEQYRRKSLSRNSKTSSNL